MLPYKLLLVEDSEAFRLLVLSALQERRDVSLIGTASDGLAVLQKIEELQPDLILLDIGLPGLDGIQVAKRAQVLAPQASILFISQEAASDIVEETFRAAGEATSISPACGLICCLPSKRF